MCVNHWFIVYCKYMWSEDSAVSCLDMADYDNFMYDLFYLMTNFVYEVCSTSERVVYLYVFVLRQRGDWKEAGAVQDQLHAWHQCALSTIDKSLLCWIRQQSQCQYNTFVSLCCLRVKEGAFTTPLPIWCTGPRGCVATFCLQLCLFKYN